VTGVEKQAGEDFVGSGDELGLEVAAGGVRGGEGFTALQWGVEDAQGHFQRGLELRELGGAKALGAAELVGGGTGEGAQAAELFYQFPGQGHDGFAGAAGAQEYGEEFGVA